MTTRDEFTSKTQTTLAKRVGHRCSNPECPKTTSGPQQEPTGAVNIGVAAHITAAAPGGMRYDQSLSGDERRAITNGIWLCQNCAKLIDSDAARYTIEVLQKWKKDAEDAALTAIEGTSSAAGTCSAVDLDLSWWKVKIDQKRHEYQLGVMVHNVGSEIVRDYHVDVEMPSAVIINRNYLISERSDANQSLFRMRWQSEADNLYPGDNRAVVAIPYFMNGDLFWDQKNVMDRLVRATLYIKGQHPITVERKFSDLQCF